MRKFFLVRFLYYFFGFSLLLILFLPAFSVVFASIKNWLIIGYWSGLDFQFVWRFLKGGLIITPIASFLLTLIEYAKYRGWNQTLIGIISAVIVAFLIAGAEYIKRHPGW
jgi:hypothetical protein